MVKIQKGHRILGVDPGSRVAGFAVIEAKCDVSLRPRDFLIKEVGVINLKSTRSLPERLGDLHNTLFDIISSSKPNYFVIEKAFVGQNACSALKLGEARGALTCAARRHHLSVDEITPAAIKKIITGSGKATKEEVKSSLGQLLGFVNMDLPHDASDALGVALAFALGLTSKRPRPSRLKDVARKALGPEILGL